MARRRHRRQRTAAFGIFVFIAAVLGVVGYGAWRLTQPVDYDPQTLCLISEESPPHMAVLLDKTDSYSERQAERIANLVRRSARDLEVGERFSMFELDERGRMDPEGSFSMCNPGRGDQVSALYNNPAQVEAAYRDQFEAPLDAIMATLIAPREAPQSPVVEAIARLALTDAFDESVPRRRVLVISDMLQNSDTFSIYGGGGALPLGMAGPEEAADAIVRQFGDRLDGVEVEVRLIPRERYEDLQRGALRQYWEDLFDALGADLTWRDL